MSPWMDAMTFFSRSVSMGSYMDGCRWVVKHIVD
jgi:hypothetical protein